MPTFTQQISEKRGENVVKKKKSYSGTEERKSKQTKEERG